MILPRQHTRRHEDPMRLLGGARIPLSEMISWKTSKETEISSKPLGICFYILHCVLAINLFANLPYSAWLECFYKFPGSSQVLWWCFVCFRSPFDLMSYTPKISSNLQASLFHVIPHGLRFRLPSICTGTTSNSSQRRS